MSGKKGIGNVAGMRTRRKGGRRAAKPDGFDRSNAQTLASQIDAWFSYLDQRNYSDKTLKMHKWSLRTFLSWAQERDLHYPQAK